MADDQQDPNWSNQQDNNALSGAPLGLPEPTTDTGGNENVNLNPSGEGLPMEAPGQMAPGEKSNRDDNAAGQAGPFAAPGVEASPDVPNIKDYFARKNAMSPQEWNAWKDKIDPKGNMSMGEVGLRIVAAQNPENKVPALQANLKMADIGLSTAAVAIHNGDIYKATEILNHAAPLIPALHDVDFSPTKDGVVITQGDQTHVLNSSQLHNLSYDPGFHPDIIQRSGGLTDLINKATQDRSPVGPQGPGAGNTAQQEVNAPLQDQDRPYTGLNPKTDYGPDAGYGYPANTQSGTQMGGTEKPIEGVTVRQDSLRQQGIRGDAQNGYYRDVQPPTPQEYSANMSRGARDEFNRYSPEIQKDIIQNYMDNNFAHANGQYIQRLTPEDVAKFTPQRPTGNQVPTSPGQQPMGQPISASERAGVAPSNAQAGAQQFQSQLPQGQAANPRGRGTFIPDARNPGHGAWTGGESAAFPPQSSQQAAAPRPGSVGPNDEVEYMGQKMTAGQAREKSEAFAAEHPQAPGWAASGTPVPAPQRDDRGKVIREKGGSSSGRTPAAQHTAEIQNQITDRTELANVYKEASHARANDKELTPIQKEVLDYYENNVMAKHRPQPQYTAADTGFPPEAVQMLRQNPHTAVQFDKIFGPGASRRVLGQ